VPNRSTRKRCKVYECRNNDWFERGMGFCSVTIISVRLPSIVSSSICAFKFYELDRQTLFVLWEADIASLSRVMTVRNRVSPSRQSIRQSSCS